MVHSISTSSLRLSTHTYTSNVTYNVGDWLNFFETSGACFSFEILEKNCKGDVYEYVLG